ncbi:MAG: hypothetical protein HOE53_01800, partial [Candidatus Magasanikbacteria bacterium]|nr:hypothetical protein [Candidatus Magasanikbacteria bacterium]
MYWILKLGGIIVALASLELIHNATLTKHPTIMALKGLGGVLAFGYGLYLYSSASRREKEEKAREKATQEQSEQLLFSSRTIHALLEQLSTAVITVVVDGHEWQAERLLNGNWREDSLQPAN